jgi:FAD/FMN-containing dehydrogenase
MKFSQFYFTLRGRNLGYGGRAPRVSGSIILDLGRMKNITVDPVNATALVEPGGEPKFRVLSSL